MFSGVRSISNRMRIGFVFLATMALILSAPFSVSAGGIPGNSISPLAIARAANIVSSIALSPRTPNFLVAGEVISMSFHYATSDAAGVIITAAPFTGTAATANATTCKTAVLPMGKGTTGTCAISVNAGPATVTAVRFQMWDAGQTTILFQAFLPVSYQIGTAANWVSGLTLSPAEPNVMMIGKGVGVKFTYRTNQPAGVRIIAMPYTGTAPTLNAVTCGATIYVAGSGTGTCRFSVATGNVNVTSIRIQMWDANHVNMIAQEVMPVLYHFRGGATLVYGASLSPQTPNFVRLGDKVTVHFSYRTNQAGIIVLAVPFAGTTPVAGATIVGSGILPTSALGKGSATFMLTGAPTRVTGVVLRVWNASRTTLLMALMLPVNYQIQ